MPEVEVRMAEGFASPLPALGRPARLLNRNVLLLWAGQFISEVGSSAFFVAMLFWLKHETNSAFWMGTMGMLAKTPGLLLGPLAGVVADRVSRRSIMIVCDLIDGLLVLSLGVWLWVFPGRSTVALVWLGLVCVINEITNAFFLPAQKAALPDLVPPQRLAAANTVELCLQEVSGLSGTLLGSSLLALAGAAAFFVFNGFSFLVSVLCLLYLVIPQRRLARAAEAGVAGNAGVGGGGGGGRGVLWSDLRESLRFLRESKGLLYCELGGLAFLFAAAMVGVMFPFYVEDVLGRSAEWYGYLAAAGGAGVFTGMVLAGTRRCDGRARLRAVGAAILAIAGGGVVFAWARQPLLVLSLLYLGGAVAGFGMIQLETLLQLAVPSQTRGRVLSLLGTVRGLVFGLGWGAGGALGEWLGRDASRLFLSCSAVLVPLTLILLASRPVRDYLSTSIEKPAEL